MDILTIVLVENFMKKFMKLFCVSFKKLRQIKKDVFSTDTERVSDWYSIYDENDKLILKFNLGDYADSSLAQKVNIDIVNLVDEIASEFDFSVETVYASKSRINKLTGKKIRYWEFQFLPKTYEKIKYFSSFF